MTVLSRVDLQPPAQTAPRHENRGQVGLLRVVPWDDAPGRTPGADPRSVYVETFWLPVLGPTAVLFLRQLADRLESSPGGFDLALDEAVHCLGLGTSRAPLRRAMLRCVRFGAARQPGPETLAVSSRLPRLPHSLVKRIPFRLQREHADWEEHQHPATVADVWRRARLVALELVALAEHPDWLERQVMAAGVHPAMACRASAWAWERRHTTRGNVPAEFDP